jgi:hypothetical protein
MCAGSISRCANGMNPARETERRSLADIYNRIPKRRVRLNLCFELIAFAFLFKFKFKKKKKKKKMGPFFYFLGNF